MNCKLDPLAFTGFRVKELMEEMDAFIINFYNAVRDFIAHYSTRVEEVQASSALLITKAVSMAEEHNISFILACILSNEIIAVLYLLLIAMGNVELIISYIFKERDRQV